MHIYSVAPEVLAKPLVLEFLQKPLIVSTLQKITKPAMNVNPV